MFKQNQFIYQLLDVVRYQIEYARRRRVSEI